MLNYLKAEGFKLCRRKYPYVFTAALWLCELLLLVPVWMINRETGHNEFSGMVNILSMLVILGLFAVVIISDMVFSDQYKHNTLKNEVSYGLSRSRIYLGKLCAAILTAVVLAVLIVGFYLALSWLLMPHGADTAVAMEGLGWTLLKAFPLWLGAAGVTMACYLNIRSNVAATFAAVGIIAVAPLMLKGFSLVTGTELLYRLSAFFLLTPFQGAIGRAGNTGFMWLIGMAWLIGSTVVGLLLFRRKEIS